MKRRRPAFSLLELILSVTLLSIGIAMAFFVFNLGTYYFKLGMSRQSLQVQGRRAVSWLEHDVRQSCIDGIQALAHTATVPGVGSVSRDSLSMPGLNDWQNAANFDLLTGIPKYNRYVVFYANQVPEGSLYRAELIPGGTTTPGRPWASFSSNFGAATLPSTIAQPAPRFTMPSGDNAATDCRILVDGTLLSFSAGTVFVNQTTIIQCSVTVRGRVVTASVGQEREEMLQFNMYAPAYNKLP